jgi:pyridoxine kinase
LLVHADAAHAAFVPRRAAAPHGTGDMIAALYLGHVLNGASPEQSLGRCAAAVEACIAASGGREELALADKGWRSATPLPAAAI